MEHILRHSLRLNRARVRCRRHAAAPGEETANLVQGVGVRKVVPRFSQSDEDGEHFYLNNLPACYTLDGTSYYLFIYFLNATLQFLCICVAT